MKRAALTALFTSGLICVFIFPSMGHAQEEIHPDTIIKTSNFDYGNIAYDYWQTNINLDSAEYYYKKAID